MKVADGDYLLRVDKPVGPTSHDVVREARRALGTRRIGHTGTLDPFASGLMVLCVGRTTRLAEYLSGMDKRYEAVARLGISTDTLDHQGEVTATDDGWRDLSDERIRKAARRQLGRIEQVPPQFSAKKVDGEAMHRRARRGEAVALAPVPVTVHALEVTEILLPDVRLTVHCSSGTYVRAIARDLGAALGCGAHLVELRRTAVGAWSVADAVGPEAFTDAARLTAARLDPTAALAHLGRVRVAPDVAARVRNGQRVRLASEAGGKGGGLISVTCDDDLVAVAELEGGLLRPRKVFPS